jgi:hypothetical protein
LGSVQAGGLLFLAFCGGSAVIKRRIAILTCCCVGMLIGLTAGCKSRLQPDEESVLYYFRAAAIHGKVRRVWPQGQAYVDKVLAAWARLQEGLEGLKACESTHSLWLPQDPRWRDAKTLSDRVGELAEIIDGGRPAREQSLRGLKEAIENLPAGLDTDRQAFVAQVWEAFELEPTTEWLASLEDTARAHLRLCREVQACADDFDPDGKGLKFKAAACQARIDRYYNELSERLKGARAAFVESAEQQLSAARDRLKEVDSRSRRHEYQYLTDLGKHLRDGLKSILKGLHDSIQEKEKELAKLKKKLTKAAPEEKGKLEADIAFIKLHIERLKAERGKWKPRIDAILAKDAQQKSP